MHACAVIIFKQWRRRQGGVFVRTRHEPKEPPQPTRSHCTPASSKQYCSARERHAPADQCCGRGTGQVAGPAHAGAIIRRRVDTDQRALRTNAPSPARCVRQPKSTAKESAERVGAGNGTGGNDGSGDAKQPSEQRSHAGSRSTLNAKLRALHVARALTLDRHHRHRKLYGGAPPP